MNDRTAIQTGRSLAAINATLGNVIANLNGSILETTTIQPGQSLGGEVIVDAPKELHSAKGPVPLNVMVTLAGDVHKFTFNITAQQGN